MNRMKRVSILTFMAVLAGCDSQDTRRYQDGFAPVTNGQLYYQAGGSGDVLVLIHGNAGDHRHWDNQFEELMSDYRVIRYDARGYGKSSIPAPGFRYSDASDLADLLGYLDVGNAHIVGWSFGSGVAFDFATAFPERTNTLVSVGPWVNGYASKAVDDLSAQMGAVANAVAQGGAVAGANAFVDLVLGETIFEESADQFMRNIASEYSWWSFTNPSQTIPLEPNAASQLSSLDVPVLVMTSEYDLPVCREIGVMIDATAPFSRQVVLKNTGHLMHIEKPDAFNAALLAFLGEPR